MGSCPRCQQPLTVQHQEGIAFQGCQACGGRLLSPDDLKTFVDSLTVTAAGPAVRNPVDLQTVQPDALCPSCQTPMVPLNYAGDSGVLLARCPLCNLLWLDRGDLERVLAVVAASDQNLTRDIKRYSADLEQAATRQDALEQSDGRAARDPLVASIASRIADADPGP